MDRSFETFDLFHHRFAVLIQDGLAVFAHAGFEPVRRGMEVHPVFYSFIAPQENKHGKHEERHPGREHSAGSIRMRGSGGLRLAGVSASDTRAGKAPYLLSL